MSSLAYWESIEGFSRATVSFSDACNVHGFCNLMVQRFIITIFVFARSWTDYGCAYKPLTKQIETWRRRTCVLVEATYLPCLLIAIRTRPCSRPYRYCCLLGSAAAPQQQQQQRLHLAGCSLHQQQDSTCREKNLAETLTWLHVRLFRPGESGSRTRVIS